MFGQAISVISTVLLFQHPDFRIASGITEVGLLQQEIISPAFSYLGSSFMIVSCLVVAFHQSKQGLHDLIAGTYCISTEGNLSK
jgi:uncharacterized RDD family membrane protein YckC